MQIEQLFSEDKQHKELIRLVNDTVTASTDWWENARRRRRYRQGEQWTDEEIAVIQGRGEPVITDNLIHDKVTSLQGMEQAIRTDPKAFPRSAGGDEAARIVTNALRYVEEQNRLDQIITRAGEYLAVEGTAAIEVIPNKRSRDPGAPEILCKLLHSDRLIEDPHSRELDYSDARFIGYESWMDRDEAAEIVGDEKAAKLHQYKNNPSWSRADMTHRDFWLDDNRDRVRIVHLYFKRHGKVYYGEFQRFDWITEPEEVVYRDDMDQPVWPIVARSAYIKDTNERYGEVERYLDVQNSVNKRQSKALHLLNTQLTTYEDGALDDPELARQELKKPDGMLEVESGYFDKVRVDRHLDLSASHQSLLALSLSRFEDIGANSALQGTQNASGRSLQVQQQAGATRLGPHFDAIDDLKIRTYRAIWHRIKQFWTAEKWVRIQDESEKRESEFAVLNQPAIDPQTGGLTIMNAVESIDVDIIIDKQQDVVSLRTEQFEKLVSMKQHAPELHSKHILMASDLPNKQEIIEDMTGGGDDPQAQAMAALQQQMQEIEMQLKQIEVAQAAANVKKTEKETEKLDAQADQIEIDAARGFYGAA